MDHEGYTMDYEGYTMDYEGYTMDYDDGAMAIRCLKDTNRISTTYRFCTSLPCMAGNLSFFSNYPLAYYM